MNSILLNRYKCLIMNSCQAANSTMSETHQEGYSRSGWKERGVGRGRGIGRGKGRNTGNRGKGENWNRRKGDTAKPDDPPKKEHTEEEAAILKRRRERFAREAQREAESGSKYGLISRGDDTRLKDDESARRSLFEETSRRVEQYNQKLVPQTDKERDAILMSFRKLRECVVAVDGMMQHAREAPSERDKRFFRAVYLDSIRFGVQCGSYESYMPALQWVLPVVASGRWGFSTAEHEWLVLRLVEQLAVMEGRYEESLLLLNELLLFRPMDLNLVSSPSPSSSVEALYLNVVSLINQDYYHVTTTALTPRGAARVAQLRLQQRSLSYRGPERYAEKRTDPQ